MESSDRLFPHFTNLPLELQCTIWRFCLPHRVEEVGVPFSLLQIDDDFSVLCNLTRTSYLNKRPPLISRICRASRTVALAAGSMFHAGLDETEYWQLQWKDPIRDSFHISWTSDDDVIDSGSLYSVVRPGTYTPETIKRMSIRPSCNNPPSLMLKAILPGRRFDRYGDWSKEAFPLLIELVQLLPKWLVVMRTIFVHCDYKTAAASGFFGLLGDAPIVVADVCKDPERAKALFDFAKACEFQGQEPPLLPQDFRWEAPDIMKRVLNDIVQTRHQSTAFTARMHPAIMYRQCPRRCNRRSDNFMSARN